MNRVAVTSECNIIINDKYEKLLVNEEEQKLKRLLIQSKSELTGDWL